MGSEDHLEISKLIRKPKMDSKPALHIASKVLQLCLLYNFWQSSSNSINEYGIVENNPDIKK
jgi:hypothetical protein